MTMKMKKRPGPTSRLAFVAMATIISGASPSRAVAATAHLGAGSSPGAADGHSLATVQSQSAAEDRSAAELDQATAELAAQLRCPVCRNQSVLESSSGLAREMQSVIRDRLAAGETPDQVKAYFVSRYGDWILLQPEARGINLLVYLLPPALLLIGGFFVVRRLRRWSGLKAAAQPSTREALNEEEREWLEKVAGTH